MYTSSCSLPATIMLICAADHGASAHAHACRPMALLARKTTNVALRDNNLPSVNRGACLLTFRSLCWQSGHVW